MSEPWLVVGLGNPGPQYRDTRHNVGQLVIDQLAQDRGESWRTHRAGARVAETWLAPGGARLILALPNSFMNVSGRPVAALTRFYGVVPERLIIVHDELDLPFGALKLKCGGGHGGHNGVRDVAAALSTAEFTRVRMGIGRPPGRHDPADWVLAPFAAPERGGRDLLVTEAAEAVELIVERGLTAAQQRVHSPL